MALGTTGAIILIVGSLVFGIVASLYFFTMMRAHRLIIRDPTNKNHFINEYLMVEVKDKETKETRWRSVFWQKKIEVEKPPAEAIEVRSKGRKFAECYWISQGQVCWIKDKGVQIKETTTKEGVKSWNIIDTDGKGNEDIIATFSPMNVTQRQALINQVKKSIQISKNKNWTPDKVIAFASVGILGIIIVCAMIFGGDIYKYHLQAQQKTMDSLDKLGEITAHQALIAKAIGTELGEFDITVTQKIKAPSTNVIISDEEKPPEAK
jgi:hypothetical protein